MFERVQQGLLGDILGVMVVAGDSSGQGEHVPLVTVDQFLKRRQRARFGAADEFMIGKHGVHFTGPSVRRVAVTDKREIRVGR